MYYAPGSHLYKEATENEKDDRIAEAVAAARRADVTVLCVGLDASIEGEEGDASNAYSSGDRPNLLLPDSQRRLVKAVTEVSDRVVIIVLSGSGLDLEAGNQVKAIVQAWYPGSQGGRAVADLLTGKFSPSGKLPITFYSQNNTLPPFEDYSMDGRPYRFLREKPLYPFGFGLSYAKFIYEEFRLPESPAKTGTPVLCSVVVRNAGETAGLETAMIYIHMDNPELRTPRYQLCGMKTVYLEPGECRRLDFAIDPYWMSMVTEEGQRIPAAGKWTVYVGGHQPDERSLELCGTPCLSGTVRME